jgi:hypothetical protein
MKLSLALRMLYLLRELPVPEKVRDWLNFIQKCPRIVPLPVN